LINILGSKSQTLQTQTVNILFHQLL